MRSHNLIKKARARVAATAPVAAGVKHAFISPIIAQQF
jgi:hypothetical protein